MNTKNSVNKSRKTFVKFISASLVILIVFAGGAFVGIYAERQGLIAYYIEVTGDLSEPDLDKTLDQYRQEVIREESFIARLTAERTNQSLLLTELERRSLANPSAIKRLQKEISAMDDGVSKSESKLEQLRSDILKLVSVKNDEDYTPAELPDDPQIEAMRILIEAGIRDEIEVAPDLSGTE